MRALLPSITLLAACASSARPPNTAELSRLQSAVGVQRPASWIVRGSYQDGTGVGQFEDCFSADGRFSRTHRSGLPGGSGFDGEQAWSLAIDGIARPSSGAREQEARVLAAVLSGSWTQDESPITITTQATAVYHLSLDGSPIIDLEVDPQSGLPRQLDLHRSKRSLALGDWRDPTGFPVPHELVLSGAGGRIARWQVDEVVEGPTSFSPPSPPADHHFAEPRSAAAARLVGVRMVLSVRCAGGPAGWWLVDTGASSSTINSSVAEELGWPHIGQATLVGAGGRTTGGLCRGGSLSLGALEVEGLPLVRVDLAPLSSTLSLELDGILGADVLGRIVLELDPPAQQAWVVKPSSWTRPAGATAITFDGCLPLLEAAFAPDHTGLLRLDTGSDDTLIFHGPTVRRLGLTHRREDLATVRVSGLGGEVLGDRGRHPWLEVAGQRFMGFPATYMRHSTGGLARADVAGNLGMGLFTGRRIVLALPHQCIVVE